MANNVVHNAQMRREAMASKSPWFVASDAAAYAKNTKRLVDEAHRDKSISARSPAFSSQFSKNGGCFETCLASVKPRTNVGVDRGAAKGVADDDECVSGTNGRTTRLYHSFSDSDLHKLVRRTVSCV